MRILIITVYYHPVMTPNVFRWSAIAEEWAAQGHEVHVLCSERSPRPREETINGVFVHRSGHGSLLDWVYNLLRVSRRRAEPSAISTAGSGLFRKFLERLTDLTWRQIYWPDGARTWLLPGKKTATKLELKYHFDQIISVSLPFTSCLIAGYLKKRFPHLHWLMDIEDPFAYSKEFRVNNRRLYKGRNDRAERLMLDRADAVTVTLENARDRYLSYFPTLGLARKIAVVPPVVNPSLFVPPTDHVGGKTGHKDRSGRIKLAYFGTFYQKVRSPIAFFELMETLLTKHPRYASKLEVHFFGDMPEWAAGGFQRFHSLKTVIRFHGLVSRQQVASEIANSDFLVNIGNTTDYHLPSKAAEYLCSGKPIINIMGAAADAFRQFSAGYPMILNLQPDQPDAGDMLVRFLDGYHGKELPAGQKEIYFRLYGVRRIADLYLDRILASQ